MTTEARMASRFQVLAESGHLFAEATTDLERLLKVVAKRFAQLIGDGCYIRLIATDGVSLVPVATAHPDPEVEQYLRAKTDGIILRIGEGISGRVVETGEPAFIPKLTFEAYAAATKPELVPIFDKVGLSSLIVVLLRARGTKLGFVAIDRNAERPSYTEDDLHLVQDLADRAALAIDNSRLLESLERRVAERTNSLEIANKELEAFAFSVSHDLRSPLRAIEGFSKILEEDHGPALDQEALRMLGVIRKNTQRMTQLIEDLLRLSRTGHRGIEPIAEVDMRSLVESVTAGILAADPARPIEMQIGELPAARGNGELLRQVWINLVENAVKYSGKRPIVAIEIDGIARDGELRYTVTDHGAGFDPRHTHKLFGVFQRLHSDAEFEGTGVGLALVQRIIAAHGGRVWGEGRLGEGATFGFALPRLR